MEFHPRLQIGNLKVNQLKVILGSFPVWSLTHDETNGNYNKTTHGENTKIGEFPYFYGSSINRFWHWYQKHIDCSIMLLDLVSIKDSLEKNKIGITDVILSCTRNGKSSLDKDLSQRTYNHDFLLYPRPGEILKILCTSKGVLNEMLLCKKFFQLHQQITYDPIGSMSFQTSFIQEIDGNYNILKKPVFVQLNVEQGGIIQCLATPSPGSPFRRLTDFGIKTQDLNNYLESYLINAFKWFNT